MAQQPELPDPNALTTIATPVATIRVLLANMPESGRETNALFQLVSRLIKQQPDMVLVGYVYDRVELLLALANASKADEVALVVLGASRVQPPPGICSHLLGEFPNLRILVLADGTAPADGADVAGGANTAKAGCVVMLYWMGLRRRKRRTISWSPELSSSATALLAEIRYAHVSN